MIGRVFITGVSSGIGLALAREYLRQGVAVYGVSRREPNELINEPKFHFERVDLANSQTVPGALKRLPWRRWEMRHGAGNIGCGRTWR